MWRTPLRIIAFILGLPVTAIGFRWLYLFVLTDDRAHFRPIIIPMGITAVILGTGLIAWSFRPLWRRGADAR